MFVCPQNILAAKGMEVLYPDMAVTDNCPNVQLKLLSGLTSGSVFPVGVTVCKYEATDASGNKSQCSFKVNGLD